MFNLERFNFNWDVYYIYTIPIKGSSKLSLFIKIILFAHMKLLIILCKSPRIILVTSMIVAFYHNWEKIIVFNMTALPLSVSSRWEIESSC